MTGGDRIEMLNATNHLGTRRLEAHRHLAIATLLVVIAALLLARGASAQDAPVPVDLTGTVVDGDTGSPLVGAWVAADGSEWGSISDDRGRFRIPDAGAGPVSLRVEQLGYEALEWHGVIEEGMSPVVLELEPKPVLLEGLRVMTDRFRARRNATATSVRAFDAGDLATSAQETALDFVTLHAGTTATSCVGSRGGTCLFLRGRAVEPTVYLDEAPVLGGLEYLDALAPHELYMIEIFGNGRHIRAYTPRYMERTARNPIAPIALFF